MNYGNRQRPTFAETIKSLTLAHPVYGKLHTDEEADVAEVLRDVEANHQGGDMPDGPDSDFWGKCNTCRTPWPCTEWVEAEYLAVLYLGRAQDRVALHAGLICARLRPVEGRA